MKIILFANTEWYLFNFRLSLLHELKNRGAEILLVSPPGPYGERLRAEGFRWHPLPMIRRSLNPFNELLTLFTLTKIYIKERPDLTHHFTIKPVIYGSIAARFARVKSQVNAVTGLGHVFISRSKLASLIRPVVRILLRTAFNKTDSLLILQNNDDKDLFLENRLIDEKKIRIIRGSGVNTSKFIPRTIQKTSNGKLRVLLATRLLWDKGLAEYVAAAQKLSQEKLNIEFLIGGTIDPGNPASASEADINEWQRKGIVTILGHIENMAQLMSEIDLVVLPSYREGTPKVLLEAAASGVPIITTDVPGCREVVDDNSNGLLIPAKDAAALAEAIRELYHNPDARSRMGKLGRLKAINEFDERIVIQRTIDVYNEVFAKTNSQNIIS